ncbi:MAG: hypothetical protein EHM93_02325 [Bacteroidales bacterium]|nr:MAG: hypothetical protein EHM93_02325 [Bacteroidales bacterium]
MNRFIALLFVALITFLAVLYVKRPDVLSNVWIWIIGLAAPIAGLFKRLYIEVKKRLSKDKTPASTPTPIERATL